ncbi:hypothetical protein BPOR_1371g00010 [Botrytis porri]|uniref:RING-type domain-containing protein n=1 Tax=Botrytis porri TaxID=87229 RepID=A0A4Z1KHY7_9HELO|nr:hypothetical protein BPOR_1371g00010 [Botrytis porri]
MTDSNPNDDLPHLIMGLTALEHRKTNMKKILRSLNEKNHSRYNKSQLLRRLHEVESGGQVSDARQQAINLWLRIGSIGDISVYYNQNDPSQQSQASRPLKRKRSAEPVSNDYGDIRIKHEDSIRCPECAVLLSFDNVKLFASETDFIRYDKSSLSSCIRSDPKSTNCLGPGCNDGQIHEGGDDQPIMTCGTWYDDQSRNRLRQEDASQDLINKATKRCPSCQVRIEKNLGCDHMTCRYCEHEFCWVCFIDYRLVRSANPGPGPPRTVFTTQQLRIVDRIRASQMQQNNIWAYEGLDDEEY